MEFYLPTVSGKQSGSTSFQPFSCLLSQAHSTNSQREVGTGNWYRVSQPSSIGLTSAAADFDLYLIVCKQNHICGRFVRFAIQFYA